MPNNARGVRQMTKNEALRMAIEVFDMYGNKMNSAFADEAYQACKQALAETQEPVAYVCIDSDAKETSNIISVELQCHTELYTTPPSREWVGLSDRELFNLSQQCDLNHILGLIDYGRAIEAKLREKNK